MPHPDLTLLIVGAGKAASTRLFAWLDEHPDVCMARPKEPQYFSRYYDQAPGTFWPPFFAHYRGERHVGEATPAYLHLPYVPGRIAAASAGARLLICVRHPVERAYSDWWMHHARGDDRETFDRAMRICVEGSDRSSADPERAWAEHLGSLRSGRIRARPYLEIGRYAEHLARFQEHFPSGQIKVMVFEDLRRDPEGTFRDLCRFLDLPEVPVASTTARNAALSFGLGRVRRLRHSSFGRAVAQLIPAGVRTGVKKLLTRHGGAQRPMPVSTREWLLEYYASHNERLGRAIGRDLSSWNR